MCLKKENTIVVLLILAGVAIATLTGDNGILTRAGEAVSKTDEASQNEQSKLSGLGEQIDYLTGYSTGGRYNEDKKVNEPKIVISEMIPIKWDGSNWAESRWNKCLIK